VISCVWGGRASLDVVLLPCHCCLPCLYSVRFAAVASCLAATDDFAAYAPRLAATGDCAAGAPRLAATGDCAAGAPRLAATGDCAAIAS